MKSSLFKNYRTALLAGILFAGSTAYSQQLLQPAPWNDPALVWLTPAQAQVAVQDKLAQLEPTLADLTPGTAQHTDLLRSIIFYKSILRSLVNALPVWQAIEGAIPEAASLGGKFEHAFTPEATLRDLSNEALALLTD